MTKGLTALPRAQRSRGNRARCVNSGTRKGHTVTNMNLLVAIAQLWVEIRSLPVSEVRARKLDAKLDELLAMIR